MHSCDHWTHSRNGWTLVVAAAATLLLASLVPLPALASGGTPGGSRGVDLLPAWVSLTTPFHLVGYAVLGALAARAARMSPAILVATLSVSSRRSRSIAGDTPEIVAVPTLEILVAATTGIVVATAVGFGVELVQCPIPWRSFAWSDAGVNAIGAVVGAGAYAIWQIVSAAPR